MTERTIDLRPMSPSDLEYLHKLVNDPNVTRFIGGLIQDREVLQMWIENLDPSDHEYVILNGGVPAGECSLTITGESGEIGYMIDPEHWNRGLGSSAINELIIIARDAGLRKVTATTDKNNAASVRILEKAGFSAQSIGWMLTGEELEDMKMGRTVVMYVKEL